MPINDAGNYTDIAIWASRFGKTLLNAPDALEAKARLELSSAVYGPAAGLSTNNALVRWDGVLGTLVKNSNAILDDSGNLAVAGTLSATGQIISTMTGTTSNGTGQLFLNGATSNRIDFNTLGFAAPAFTTRSVGTKIVLYPEIGVANTDYAIGIDTSTLWFSVPLVGSGRQFQWYGGTTLAATLTGGGALTLVGAFQAASIQSTPIGNTTPSTGAFTTLSATGAITTTATASGVGYATGAGGTVSQLTSRTTGVTINRPCGAITLFSAAGSATYRSFTVTNSVVVATDVVRVTQKSGTDNNIILVTNTAAGTFVITFATTGGTTVEAPVFNFAVIKAVTS